MVVRRYLTFKLNKESLFYLAFCFYFGALFLNSTLTIFIDQYKIIVQVLKLVSVLLLNILNINLLIRKYKLSNFLYTLSLILCGILSVIMKDLYFIVLVFFILAASNLQLSNLFKFSFWLLVSAIFIVLMFCLLGILPNEVTYRSVTDLTLRYSLGFQHSSKLPIAVMYLSIYYFIDHKKYSVRSIVIFELLAILLYFVGYSRNSLVCMTLLSFFLLCYKLIGKKINYLVYFLSKNIVIICTGISVVLLLLYHSRNPIGILADKLLTNRLFLAERFLQISPLKFVKCMSYSDYISLYDNYAIGLDNGFFYILFKYGLVFIGIWVLINRIFISKVKQENNYVAMIAFSIIIISFIIDNTLFGYGVLPIYIYGFSKISKDDNLERKIE